MTRGRTTARAIAIVAAFTVVGLAAAACSGGGADEASARRSGASAAFCDKAAEFQQATRSVRGIASADQMQAAVDQLGEVAAEAPTDLADEFDTLQGVLVRLVTALRATEGGDQAATLAAMQKVLTPETSDEVDAASRDVAAFLRVECGFDPEQAAATDPTTPPTSAAAGDPAAVGSDPVLGPLATACHDGDMVSCDELYFAAPDGSPYEAYGDTCGQRTSAAEYCVDIYPPPDG